MAESLFTYKVKHWWVNFREGLENQLETQKPERVKTQNQSFRPFRLFPSHV